MRIKLIVAMMEYKNLIYAFFCKTFLIDFQCWSSMFLLSILKLTKVAMIHKKI
jgi:hypothetical protein